MEKKTGIVGGGQGRQRLMATIGAMAMLAGAGEQFPEEVKSYRSESTKNDFRKFHDSLRAISRRGRVFHSGRTPYVKPVAPGEVKGKLARKAAKRKRMAALRAAQVSNERGLGF